jgi:type I restriction enzyme, S subunit
MDNYNSTSPRFPDGWMTLVFGDFIERISTNGKKIKQKEYLEIGDIPIIDQGYKFIGGFTNNEENTIECDLPVIVFGDHTKIVKIVNFRFAPGARAVSFTRKTFYASLLGVLDIGLCHLKQGL